MKINKEHLERNINSIVQYDFMNHKIFGAAYYVFQNNNIEFSEYFGTLSPTTDAKVNDRTLFRLASMTKPITTIATLILIERGVLSLEDTVDKYIPAFKDIYIKDMNGKVDKPSRMPTIRNLLSHSSGIGSLDSKYQRMMPEDKKSIDNTIAFYMKEGLDFEPGTAQKYSGIGAFDVLTKIIELVTGTDYMSFLKKEILIPCNMPDTTFIPNAEQLNRCIKMHNKEKESSVLYDMPEHCIFRDFPWSHYLGGAGLVSTMHDYCNFVKLLFNKGIFEGHRIIDESTFSHIYMPQISKDIMPGSVNWGLGVRVICDEKYPYLPIGTYGWSGAFGSHFWVDPVNEICCVYMKNSNYDGGAGNESAVKFEEAVYSSVFTTD